MFCPSTSPYRSACLRAIVGGLLLTLGAACAGDKTGPSSETTDPTDSPVVTPTDSAAAPTDSIAAPTDSITAPTAPTDSLAAPTDTVQELTTSTSQLPGIVYGTWNIPKEQFGSLHTGSLVGGALSPSNMLTLLSYARAKGARYVIKLCMGSDQYIKNPDGTFSFTKWKSLVDRFRTVNFASYITDGTVVGHFLIDEPSRASRWGGKVISQAQIEAMAKYSKSIWPGMATFVRVVPTWLAATTVSYTYLDAGWFQYAARFGNPTTAVAAEVAAAKSKGLGLMLSMNVMDGGNGTSGIRGVTSGKWAMSATEVRNYGTALIDQTYACGFYQWTWNSTYYGRSDIKSAMSALSTKAKGHAKTSCRQ